MIADYRIVEIYTADAYLFQKIKLSAPDGVRVTQGSSGTESPIRLVDLDTADALPEGETVTLSRTREDADIKIPFSLDILDKLFLQSENEPALRLLPDERCAYLNGEKIRLTEVEYHLMSELFSACGEYKSRDELLFSVWGRDADPGVLNVYVHYLREKLERRGEKIILSSRKCGYKISEKYAQGGKNADAQNN